MESAPPLVARAKQLAELRAARKAAKAAAVTESEAAEARRIKELTDRAKANGQVEKTAGESGAAGALRRKWEKWLACVHGRAGRGFVESEERGKGAHGSSPPMYNYFPFLELHHYSKKNIVTTNIMTFLFF